MFRLYLSFEIAGRRGTIKVPHQKRQKSQSEENILAPHLSRDHGLLLNLTIRAAPLEVAPGHVLCRRPRSAVDETPAPLHLAVAHLVIEVEQVGFLTGIDSILPLGVPVEVQAVLKLVIEVCHRLLV